MFHFAPDHYRPVPEAMLRKLKLAITNKLTFVVCLAYSYIYRVLSGPETLLVAYDYWDRTPTFLKMLLEILNRRWQTLDLKNIMSELQRSFPETMVIEDTCASVHRFKRKEGASLS